MIDVADNNLNWFVATAQHSEIRSAKSAERALIRPDRCEPTWEGDLPLDENDPFTRMLRFQVASAYSIDTEGSIKCKWTVEWCRWTLG